MPEPHDTPPNLLEELRDGIRSQGWSLADALREFEDLDHWTVRKVYAEERKRQQLEYRPSMGDLSRHASLVLNAGWFQPVKLNVSPVRARPRYQRAGKQTLIINDIHAPLHDPHALDVVYQVGQALPLDGLIINGDLFDCSSLSRFTPSAQQPLRWVDERLQALPVAAEIRGQFPDLPITFRLGNHDVRVQTWIDAHATPLQGLFTTEQMLGIEDLGFEVADTEQTWLAEGNLLVKHGTKVSKHAGYSVKKEMEDAGTSVIMGHVHRRAIVEVTKTAHTLIGVEAGCLCTLKPSYLPPEDTANWQQAAVVVTEYGEGQFDVEMLRIANGKAMFRGEIFTSRL